MNTPKTDEQLSAVGPQVPLSARIKAYLDERFPMVSHGVLILSYYSSNQFLAEVLTRPNDKLRYTIGSVLGAITLFCMFLHLRVFDEHKDYDDDLKHYPDRVLQSGVVTLMHLKILGAIAIGLEIVFALVWMPTGKPAALVAVMIAIGYSVLMLNEFFVRDWLKRHFLIYTISHMLVMPIFAMVVYSFTTGEYPWEAPLWFWVYAFVGFFVTLNWEISRKIRAPEEEIAGVDSYTKILGTYGAAYAVLIVRIIDTLIVAWVGWHIGASQWFYCALVALFLICLVGFFQFRFNTNAKTAKRMETYAGLYIIAFDLILAVELIRSHGVQFSWM
ncbi:MAG: UbiA family prenyltransferase [Mariniblastus sp.]